MSKFQKLRQRRRLRAVDNVVDTIEQALAKKGETVKAVERWRAEMPTEAEMLPKDKYTVFARNEKRYRKGIHSMYHHLDTSLNNRQGQTLTRHCFFTEVPKWTRVSQRVNPPGY